MALEHQTNAAVAPTAEREPLLWGLGLRLESCWQFDLAESLSDYPNHASESPGTVQHRRFDGREAVRGPILPIAWSTQVGLNQPIGAELQLQSHRVANKPVEIPGVVPSNPKLVQTSTPSPASQVASAAQLSDASEQRLLNMLAEVAHDIRTPIATASQIIGSIVRRAGAQAGFTHGDAELLNIANSRLMQASNWAEGILLEESLQQGRPIAIRNRFYPHQWRALLQPLLEAIAGQRDVKLSWSGWERSLPRLYLDTNQLSRAVLNLVSNAIQASNPGQEVVLRVIWQHSDPQRLRIAIQDSGPGLRPEFAHEVNRSAASTASANLGLGLGLRTAKSLVLALGGSMSVQCSPQDGTSFYLSLPIDDPGVLVRNWLTRNAIEESKVASGLHFRAGIHAVRANVADHSFVDSQLQASACSREFVYRIAKDRWLWLDLAAEPAYQQNSLAEALAKLKSVGQSVLPLVRTSLVFQTDTFAWEGLYKDGSLRTELERLTKTLASKVVELMDGRIPAVDELLVGNSAMLVRPLVKERTQKFERVDQPSFNRPHLPRALVPDSKLSEALEETAKGWRTTHSKLKLSTKASCFFVPPPSVYNKRRHDPLCRPPQ